MVLRFRLISDAVLGDADHPLGHNHSRGFAHLLRNFDTARGDGKGSSKVADPNVHGMETCEEMEFAPTISENLGQIESSIYRHLDFVAVAAGKHRRDGESLKKGRLMVRSPVGLVQHR